MYDGMFMVEISSPKSILLQRSSYEDRKEHRDLDVDILKTIVADARERNKL